MMTWSMLVIIERKDTTKKLNEREEKKQKEGLCFKTTNYNYNV